MTPGIKSRGLSSKLPTIMRSLEEMLGASSLFFTGELPAVEREREKIRCHRPCHYSGLLLEPAVVHPCCQRTIDGIGSFSIPMILVFKCALPFYQERQTKN